MLLKATKVSSDRLGRLAAWLSSPSNRINMKDLLEHESIKGGDVEGILSIYALNLDSWSPATSTPVVELVSAERKGADDYTVTLELPGIIHWRTTSGDESTRHDNGSGEILLPSRILIEVHRFLACK